MNTIFIPELLQAGIQAKLGNAIKLQPLAYVKPLGKEQAGDKITLPTTSYVGMAEKVVAGQPVPMADFAQSVSTVTVEKFGKGVTFTEEDVNNAYSDVQGEAENQLVKSIADGIENEMFVQLKGITGAMLHSATETALSGKVVGDALVKFGEDLDGEKYLLVSPADYALVRDEVKDGMLYDCKVMVSARVGAKEAFVVKPEALGQFVRQDVKVEVEKDIKTQTYVLVATAHGAIHLRDASKAVKISIATV